MQHFWTLKLRVFWKVFTSHLINYFSFTESFLWRSLSEMNLLEVFCEKVFLKIWQNSQENICARDSFLIELQTTPATLLKKRLWHRCFPVNFAKLLRTPFPQTSIFRANISNFRVNVLDWKHLCSLVVRGHRKNVFRSSSENYFS